MVSSISLQTKMHTSQNLTVLVALHGGGGVHVLQLCLQGVSRARSHRVQIFIFFSSFLFALVYFSWKEMLQNSSHVTPEQKEMSGQILSNVVFWLSVGQSESCKARLTLFPLWWWRFLFTAVLWELVRALMRNQA